MLGVAAELDVDAAAGHVGGDRDRAGAAGLGDDLALALGVLGLGVEHRVRDAASCAARSDSSSETSTEIVPTSTGWPLSWRSWISRATARHLPSLVLKIWSFWSLRTIGRLVGISTTPAACRSS